MANSADLWVLLFCVLLFSSGVMSQYFHEVAVKENLKSLGVKSDEKPSTTVRVYQADMLKGIEDFIVTILPNVPLIDWKSRNALDEFMGLLKNFQPLSKREDDLMYGLQWDVKQSNGLTGKQLSEKLKSRKDFGRVFNTKNYIGCASSKPHERGYPCALWILFHHLLDRNVYATPPFIYQYAPGDILSIFRNFIKYFYQCPQCVDNFEGMFKRRPIDSEMTHKEAILWLWATHNEFNKLTANQPGDPMFPKVQFPTADMCPPCRNKNSSWRRNEVVKYLSGLHHFYNVSGYYIYG
ncbi:sulfhydryl oxidase 2-like [Drosophila subpulchrella]|uniref:sulfhydryl oxidase 2-like n=1 Tax=Drosophila subpulchrella TaxID=1486046 RepID=UPI0018A1B1BA|nr:sulfhydryl oxidase 2-like [Drosophila subpulchrella]